MELSCSVFSAPLPEVVWVFVGEEDGGESVVPAENITTLERATSVTSTLTLPAAQLSEAGQYACVATNYLGNDTALANLTVFGKTKL